MCFCYNIFDGVSMKAFGVRDLCNLARESNVSNRRLAIGTATAGRVGAAHRTGGPMRNLEQALGFVPADLEESLCPVPSETRRVVFRAKKALVGLVYDAAALEGSPYTFPEVHTLLDGYTVGGHRLEDERLVLNLRDAWTLLFSLVLSDQFSWSQETYCTLHAKVAFEEALTWGTFRNEAVSVAGTTAYVAPPWQTLSARYQEGIDSLATIDHPFIRSLNFFLFGAINQFFFDGNKRTARLMMNGALMTHGYDAISIPAARRSEFNLKMLRFYDHRDGTDMGNFLVQCISSI